MSLSPRVLQSRCCSTAQYAGPSVLLATFNSSSPFTMSTAAWQEEVMTPKLWESIFYTTFTTVRTAIITPILVCTIFATLRLSGSRTLTQSTLFNKIVLVAVGSIVGSSALRPSTPVVAVVIAAAVIVGIALLVNAAHARGLLPNCLVHPCPILLFANGQMLSDNLRRCMLAPEKVHSELRVKGHASMSKVFAVVLEPTGTFSVITQDKASKSDLSLLRNVQGFDKHLKHLVDNDNSAAAAPSGPQGV